MSSQDLFKILKNDGWVLKSVVGSHHHFVHLTKSGKVTVPHPRKDLAPETVNSILKQAGLKYPCFPQKSFRRSIMDNITYPVILTYEDNIIYAGVPDLGIDNCATYGDTLGEALQNIKEVITLYLDELEEEEKEFPKASDIKSLKKDLKENQELVYINLYLPYERSLIKIAYKKKTLSIPVWLDILATNKNLNFSQILQAGLKKELGIDKN